MMKLNFFYLSGSFFMALAFLFSINPAKSDLNKNPVDSVKHWSQESFGPQETPIKHWSLKRFEAQTDQK